MATRTWKGDSVNEGSDEEVLRGQDGRWGGRIRNRERSTHAPEKGEPASRGAASEKQRDPTRQRAAERQQEHEININEKLCARRGPGGTKRK